MDTGWGRKGVRGTESSGYGELCFCALVSLSGRPKGGKGNFWVRNVQGRMGTDPSPCVSYPLAGPVAQAFAFPSTARCRNIVASSHHTVVCQARATTRPKKKKIQEVSRKRGSCWAKTGLGLTQIFSIAKFWRFLTWSCPDTIPDWLTALCPTTASIRDPDQLMSFYAPEVIIPFFSSSQILVPEHMTWVHRDCFQGQKTS